MNEITLPPSPNWYLSNILAIANDGTVAWGARNSIVLGKTKEDLKQLDFSIIDNGYRITCIAFSPKPEEMGSYRLVSGGDSNIVNVWSLQDLKLQMKNSILNSGQNVIGVDWSKHNSNLVCFVSEDGVLVTWNLNYDASQVITLGKLTATCLSCCPHNCNLVAIGSKVGLVYLIDIRGSGSITYKLRGHDAEIVSLSWCPIPVNIFENKDTKEFLLASGAKDRDIFLWKAGTDGRYQTKVTLPQTPLDSSNHKSKVSSSAGNYTAVCWLEPTTLLTSSPWGELLMWELNGSTNKKFVPRLIHSKHGRGLFSIAGLADKPVKQTDENNGENWRLKTNIKAIWTIAQDKQVICCSLLDNEPSIKYVIPTQGGFVYCISACPVDTSQIAFGVGDAMIRLWNLSEPHETIIELQMMWEKIKGQVRAISWHPEKENLLAFATNEGRVGVFDTNSKKPPLLCRQYHRHIVYSIGWGPAPNVKEYALYSCGDGELVYYNFEKPNENPVSVTKKKNCTEFSWKPDYTILALGFGDGSIIFLNRDLNEFGKTINILYKAIQFMTWHPESTTSDLNLSTMKNYLAVAIIGTAITIFDISTSNSNEEKSDELPFYRIVATLNGHKEKVVCLSWSPHISGYLVSGSYDNTAQVWKVETQEVIATYSAHLGPVQCCMWSPFSQDLIITGSADFTVRIWNIKNQEALILPSLSQPSKKGKRTKKKKTIEAVIMTNKSEDVLNIPKSDESIHTMDNNQKTNSEEITGASKNVNKLVKKKKLKKVTHFPGYSEIVHDNKLWCDSVRHLLKTIEQDIPDNESGVFDCNDLEHSPNKSDNIATSNDKEVALLLGSKQNLEDVLNREKKILELNGQHGVVTEINLWSDNLKENLQEALKNKRLSDFLVSLAPRISIDTWKEMCEAYANQLLLEENPHRAVSYLLCINKVQEAIEIFVTSKLYKEAYALATLRLDSNDPMINNILREWAKNAIKDGNFQSATECYIKLGELVNAAKVLERRKDIDSLILAIELAEFAKDADLSTSLADRALLVALFDSQFATAKSIIEKHPQIQFRKLEVEVFIELNKILENTNNETIFNWLKCTSSIALLEMLNSRFAKCIKQYSILLQKDVYPLVDASNEKMVQINVCHQIALSILSDNVKQQLQHIVKACDIISQYEKITSTEKKLLLLKYLCSLDNKNLADSSSIFNADENGVSQSLRAYLCHAFINWFHELKMNEEQTTECTNLIISILEKCVNDLLNKQAIQFWTTTNEISRLETQLFSQAGQKENEGEDSGETKEFLERLDELRNKRKEFIDSCISAPNPLFSYGAVMEFISKISDEQTCQKITELVMDTWKKAIS